MEAVGVVAVGVGGALAEPGRLAYRFRQIFGEVADVAACFFGAAQDALDVHLGPEPDNVRRLDQVLAGMIEGGQRCPGVGVGEGLRPGVPDR